MYCNQLADNIIKQCVEDMVSCMLRDNRPSFNLELRSFEEYRMHVYEVQYQVISLTG
jgi:hypothetical protein